MHGHGMRPAPEPVAGERAAAPGRPASGSARGGRAPRGACAAAALALALGGFPAAAEGVLGGALELVDPDVLRVCADPSNLPFSNEAGEGFENALAERVAEWTGREGGVAYAWHPQVIGFVRNTLGKHRCDVVMGFAQGHERVQNTNAYYRTAYVLAVPEGSDLRDVASLSDPRLKGRTIGVVAGTPPATVMAAEGLIADARPYKLMVDTRTEAPVAEMFADLRAGEIDAAAAWGPMAGWHAREGGLTLIPLLAEDGPRMVYRITMGVRPSDQEWKRELNRVIDEHGEEIDALLTDYGVPLLDERDEPIPPGGGG